MRNIGGRITPGLLQQLGLLARIGEVAGEIPGGGGEFHLIVLHHTDCGMLTFTDDAFKRSIQDETGIKPPWSAEAFPDLDEDVRQSIARIKASPFIPHKDSIRGFVFDVATGKLNEVS